MVVRMAIEMGMAIGIEMGIGIEMAIGIEMGIGRGIVMRIGLGKEKQRRLEIGAQVEPSVHHPLCARDLSAPENSHSCCTDTTSGKILVVVFRTASLSRSEQ